MLKCILRRKETEVNRNVFDRGKEQSILSTSEQRQQHLSPAIKVLSNDHYSNTPIRLETDDWIKTKHGKWRPTNTSKINVMKANVSTSMQSDSGANRIVTDDLTSLQNITFISPYPMGGCNKDEIAIVCTAKGILSIPTLEGGTLRLET